jgi:hypothetical protein
MNRGLPAQRETLARSGNAGASEEAPMTIVRGHTRRRSRRTPSRTSSRTSSSSTTSTSSRRWRAIAAAWGRSSRRPEATSRRARATARSSGRSGSATSCARCCAWAPSAGATSASIVRPGRRSRPTRYQVALERATQGLLPCRGAVAPWGPSPHRSVRVVRPSPPRRPRPPLPMRRRRPPPPDRLPRRCRIRRGAALARRALLDSVESAGSGSASVALLRTSGRPENYTPGARDAVCEPECGRRAAALRERRPALARRTRPRATRTGSASSAAASPPASASGTPRPPSARGWVSRAGTRLR